MKTKGSFLTAGLFLATLVDGFGQPMITRQPTNQSVSLGATANFRVTATTTNLPLSYQWRFNTNNLEGKTNFSLSLTNVQLTNAGSYDALATDMSGSVTSQVATLTVDPTFTKITTGPVVTDRGSSAQGAWADYDGDGYLDLFVSNGGGGGALDKNFLYRNNGDGTFTKVTTGIMVTEDVQSHGGAWGDYDNDGYPDLFVPGNGGRNDLLYDHERTGGHRRAICLWRRCLGRLRQ